MAEQVSLRSVGGKALEVLYLATWSRLALRPERRADPMILFLTVSPCSCMPRDYTSARKLTKRKGWLVPFVMITPRFVQAEGLELVDWLKILST